MARRGSILIAAAVGSLGTMLLGGIAWAAIPSTPGGVIQGCYDSGGNVKVVEALPCPKNQTPFQWNQQGPPGTNGTNGTNGTDGTNGKDGEDGKDGAPGADGVSGYEVVTASGTGGFVTASCPTGKVVLQGSSGFSGVAPSNSQVSEVYTINSPSFTNAYSVIWSGGDASTTAHLRVSCVAAT